MKACIGMTTQRQGTMSYVTLKRVINFAGYAKHISEQLRKVQSAKINVRDLLVFHYLFLDKIAMELKMNESYGF